MKMRQCLLRDQDGYIMTCWLPLDKRIRAGARLTLKTDDDTVQGVWTVAATYPDITEEKQNLRRTWGTPELGSEA